MVSQTEPKPKRKATGAAALGAGPGRPKGSRNKLALKIEECLDLAFDRAGGVEALVKLARSDEDDGCLEDRKIFWGLQAKRIRSRVELSGEGLEAILTKSWESKVWQNDRQAQLTNGGES